MQAILSGLALAGSSLVVWPGVGDSVREPKWVWLWALALGQLLYWFRHPPPLRSLPRVMWPCLAYALLQPYFFSPATLVWPFTLNLAAIFVLAVSVPAEVKFLRAATWAQLLLALLQALGQDPLFEARTAGPVVVGFLGQHTLLGAWMAALAWFWFGKKEWWLFGLCSLLAFSTGSLFTIAGWGSAPLALLFWRRHRARWPALALGFTLLAAAFLYSVAQGPDGVFSAQGRYSVWRLTLSAALLEPWFGYGLDSYHREFHAYHQGLRQMPWWQAHNEYLELFFGGGLVGLVLGVSLVVALLRRRNDRLGREEPWFLALVVLLTNSIGSFPLHIAPMALLAAMAYMQLARREPAPPRGLVGPEA